MRIVTAAERRALPRPASQSRVTTGISRKIARAKAIERELAAYVSLKCGHKTTREEIDFYSVWQTKPHRYYCDDCQSWVDEEKIPEPIANFPLDELPF